jgi:hypothetical protein
MGLDYSNVPAVLEVTVLSLQQNITLINNTDLQNFTFCD